MELDRDTWHRAVTRVQRVATTARVLWWGAVVVPLALALFAYRELLLEAVVVALLSLVFVHRLFFRIGAGTVVNRMQSMIQTAGHDLTKAQVAQLLHSGLAPGDGVTWVTIHEDNRVRLVAEGRVPGKPARSSSPWIWAMPPGF